VGHCWIGRAVPEIAKVKSANFAQNLLSQPVSHRLNLKAESSEASLPHFNSLNTAFHHHIQHFHQPIPLHPSLRYSYHSIAPSLPSFHRFHHSIASIAVLYPTSSALSPCRKFSSESLVFS